MALFDFGQFDPQAYQGSAPPDILSALKLALMQKAQAMNPPDQPQVGPTSAQGNQGSMGGVPFPIFGQPSPQDQAQLPTNAQPTQGAMPPAMMPQQQPMAAPQMPQQAPSLFGNQPQSGDNIFSRLGAALNPARAMQMLQLQQAQMASRAPQATYESLRRSGVPDAMARAAALNPEILKTIAPAYFDTKPQFGVIGQNQMGVNQYGFINPQRQTVTPANAQGTQGNLNIDPTLTGEDFLKAVAANPQLGPGKAQLVKSIAEGRVPYPSGFIMKTPFGQWLTTAVGQYEPGLDATLIGQRRIFNQQMGSSSPSSVGGQKTLMGTSLGHLSEIADAALKLGNSAGPLPDWFPGSAAIAHGENRISNSATARSAQVNALSDAVQKFSGEVGKLYSGSSGGGITERDETRARFSANLSPQEMAASLEMSKGLIESKLAALESQQDQIFGPNNKNRVDFLGQKGHEAIAKIDAAIVKLRGQGGAAAPQPAQGQFTPPANWQFSPSRNQFRDPQGNIYDSSGKPVK